MKKTLALLLASIALTSAACTELDEPTVGESEGEVRNREVCIKTPGNEYGDEFCCYFDVTGPFCYYK